MSNMLLCATVSGAAPLATVRDDRTAPFRLPETAPSCALKTSDESHTLRFMKAYQSEARRQILRDPVGRKSLRAFLEKRGLAVRQGLAVAERQGTDVVVTSNGHRFSVRLVPTR